MAGLKNNGDRPEEAAPGELVAKFQAYFSKMNNTRFDEVALTFVVLRDDKYRALPLTDQAGFLYEFEVRRPKMKAKPSDAIEMEETAPDFFELVEPNE